MGGNKGARSVCLVCFLCFAGWTVFAVQGKQVQRHLLVNTAANLLATHHDIPNEHHHHHNIGESNQKIGGGPQQHSRGRRSKPAIPNQGNGNGNGTTWCIAKPSTSQEKLDDIIEFCCTQKGVDCGVIQAGGNCYLPPNKISDASVVMNIFYKLNGKLGFTCDFNRTGLIVTQDPSVGNCIYPA
ncbi:PREDICTED: major pollen allergen Ole e 10-like [Erythranthe guttata]|nr:PREDICTED: major pollen allergen Ole e 10-like [Erythranthe guttata]|eukprot:XP_012842618.1 PREDICTED: major pollen allergen Ole e 10-like [Erythranthe guttata]